VTLIGMVIIMLAAPVYAQRKKQVQQARPKRSSVVDDSTKAVYGPKTTLTTTEKSLFYNDNVYTPIDTSISNYHRWTYVQRFNNYYKDIGNVGTALCPIFPTLSSTIGATSGFTVYHEYYDTEEPRYFDTKSPYTRIQIIWGGKGRAMTRVEFSRPINPRWNFGFNFRPILADKQIQYQKAVRQTMSYYYDFYTSYKSKDTRYLLLFNYRRIRHRVFENGGVVVNQGDTYKDFFDKDAAVHLIYAVSEEDRTNLHLFQQYHLAGPLQVYMTNDLIDQNNKYTDETANETPPGYYDYIRGDSTYADDKAEIKILQNEAGVKGSAGPLFYNFYFKLRAYDYQNHYGTPTNGNLLAYQTRSTEKYLGGRVRLRYDSVTELNGSAEYLLDGHYRLNANWVSPWIDASATSMLSKPGFMQQIYYGSYDLWTNSFSKIASQQLSGFIKANIGPLFISPGATFSTFNNYVFFRQQAQPVEYQKVLPFQSHGSQVIFSPELRMSIRFAKHFYFRPQVISTALIKNDDDAFHIPTLFINTQLAYENSLFHGNLLMQVGLDAHWKSTYQAMGYDPAIQQFYIQNTSQQASYLLADVFLNGKIKRGRFFLKYHNLVQAFTGIGYVPTPGYQGQRNIMDFGFELLLFD
jgi:Putative porin